SGGYLVREDRKEERRKSAGRRDLAALPQIRVGLRADIRRAARVVSGGSRQTGHREGGDRRPGRVSRVVFCADVFHYRRRVGLQETLGRRDRPAGGGVSRLSVRFHHLDRAGDFVAVFPRRKTSDYLNRLWLTSRRFRKSCARWSTSRCCRSRRNSSSGASCWACCCSDF